MVPLQGYQPGSGGIKQACRKDTIDKAARIGYEISFTRHFYKPQPLRTLEEIRADIQALQKETEGLLSEIVGGGRR